MGNEMKEYTLFIIIFIICILGMLTVTTIQRESLIIENEALKAENHMLENALNDLGVEIEELSTTVDELIRESNRGDDWNEEVIPEYRR